MSEIKLPEVGQHVRLAANADEGWPEVVGEWLGDGVMRLLEEHREADDPDGLLDGIDLTDPYGEIWSIVEDDVVTDVKPDENVVDLVLTRDLALQLREIVKMALLDAPEDEDAAEVLATLNELLS